MTNDDDNLDDLIGPAPLPVKSNKPWLFQKGHPGGPGRPPVLGTPVAKLTRAEITRIGMLLLEQSWDALQQIANDSEESSLAVMLASVCLRVRYKGDMAALDLLLNRLIGKVRDELIVDGHLSGSGPQVIVHLPANGREAKDQK